MNCRKRGAAALALSLLAAWFLAGCKGGGGSAGDGSLKANEYLLTCGFYTAGIDIPAGSGELALQSGEGSAVYETPDGMQTNLFGKGKSKDGYIEKAEFALKEGSVVKVGGTASIKAVFKDPTRGNNPREYDESKAAVYEAGSYAVGTDIPEGRYTLKAAGGRGSLTYVSTSSYIDEAFGVDDGTGIYVPTIANAELKPNTLLTIGEGLKVEFVPEKAESTPPDAQAPGGESPAPPIINPPLPEDKPYDGNEPEGTSEEKGITPDQFEPEP
jgi:hypothetical protein